jgi:hypothetical protein
MSESNLSSLCDSLMRSVVSAIYSSGREIMDCEQASQVLRQEMKDFLFGASYENERYCLMSGTLSEQYILASIVSSCIIKIQTKVQAK